MVDFVRSAKPLSEVAINQATETLGIEAPALWAVMTVETKGCGFLPDRRPQILFERHIFHRLTNGQFDAVAPDVSMRKAGGYGAAGAFQYERLSRAMALNHKAALESCSWGLGQIMGFNADKAGYPDVESMIEAMCESEDGQFSALVGFVAENGLAKHLKAGNWEKFAYYYNGEDYQKNKYDTNLAAAHARYLAGPLPSLTVRSAQLYLMFLGYKPGKVDGWYGQTTQKALIGFQRDNGLPASGSIDETSMEALRRLCTRLAGN